MKMEEGKKVFNSSDLHKIEAISEEFWNEIQKKEGQILNKGLFLQLLLALVASIPIPNFFEFLGEHDENSVQKWLENRYQALINLKKVDFSSRNREKRIEAKYFYFERAFKLRAEIQSYEYDYHSLDSSAANFIRSREIAKLHKEQMNTYGLGELECGVCGTKFLKEETAECLVCKYSLKLESFIVIAGFFNVIGDMKTFWEELSESAELALADHWKEIKEFFQREKKLRRSRNYNALIKEFGEKQYKELIKPTGDLYHVDGDLRAFNSKHNTAIVAGTEEIDLRQAKNGFDKDLMLDLGTLRFPFCRKIRFPPRRIDINDFKPNMPRLEEIEAEKCHIKAICLDSKFFPVLRKIDLRDNEIENEFDIHGLRNIETLKLIDLQGCPIERSPEIFRIKKSFLQNGIELRISAFIEFPRRINIEEESDESIRADMEKFQDCYDTQSQPSLSK